MNYHSKNPVLTRSGRYNVLINNIKYFSAPRTITYTNPSSARSFTYQTPKNQNIDLKGNLNKRIELPEAKEENM